MSCDSASIFSYCSTTITPSNNLDECLFYNEQRRKFHLQGVLRNIFGNDGSSVSDILAPGNCIGLASLNGATVEPHYNGLVGAKGCPF
jgi:hypothetical protein